MNPYELNKLPTGAPKREPKSHNIRYPNTWYRDPSTDAKIHGLERIIPLHSTFLNEVGALNIPGTLTLRNLKRLVSLKKDVTDPEERQYLHTVIDFITDNMVAMNIASPEEVRKTKIGH